MADELPDRGIQLPPASAGTSSGRRVGSHAVTLPDGTVVDLEAHVVSNADGEAADLAKELGDVKKLLWAILVTLRRRG